MLEIIQDAFSTPGQSVGHISYVLIIVSMLMRDIFWLRIFAVLSGFVELWYRLAFIHDPVSVFWETIFIAVNVVQLALLWNDHFRVRFTPDEEQFVQAIVPHLHRVRAHKLVKTGQWRTFAPGQYLTHDGQLAPELVFISTGQVDIKKAGVSVALCSTGDFIGEMSIITGEPASADAVAKTEVSCLCFERSALGELTGSEADLRHALEASFNRNLAAKLVKANDQKTVATAEHVPG